MKATKADNGRCAISEIERENLGRGIIYTVPNTDKKNTDVTNSKLLDRIENANKLYNVFFKYNVPYDLKKHFEAICKIVANSTEKNLVSKLSKYTGYRTDDNKIIEICKFSHKATGQQDLNDFLKLHIEQCMSSLWQDEKYKKVAVMILECICKGKKYSENIQKLAEHKDKPLFTFMEACKINKYPYVKDTSKLEEGFTLLVKNLVEICDVEAYCNKDEEKIKENLNAQIEFLRNITHVKKKVSSKNKEYYEEISLNNYLYEYADENRMNAILIRMRKSIKRGSNRQIAIKLLQAIAVENGLKALITELENNKQLEDDLRKFLSSVNKDYYRVNIILSVKKLDLRVQANKKNSKTRLDIAGINGEKKALNDTLEAYAASKESSDNELLKLKTFMIKYFAVNVKTKLSVDELWKLPKEETYFDDGFEEYKDSDIDNIVDQNNENSDKDNGTNQNNETKNVTTLETYWSNEKISKNKDKAIKKRIKFVNYGKYLSIVKAEKPSEFDIYWASFIKEYIEKEYVQKKQFLSERDCKKTTMLKKCWKHIIQYLCGKYIDLGKSVYHFVIPEEITNESRFDELKDGYEKGISSFAHENIKAEETRQREIAKATATAVSNFTRAVINYNSTLFENKNKLEDILFIEDKILKQILQDNSFRQILRFYGGMSQSPYKDSLKNNVTVQESGQKTVQKSEQQLGQELVLELCSHFKKIRNTSFHYTDGKEITVSAEYTKKLMENDISAYKKITRQHYYSNNVIEFYKKENIKKLVKKLYSEIKISEAQIPAFKTVWKRKDMHDEIASWASFSVQDAFANDKDKKLRFESALYFILKEIYYRDYILRPETKDEFKAAVDSKVNEYKNIVYPDKNENNKANNNNKANKNIAFKEAKQYLNAGRSFKNFLDKVYSENSSASFGLICQAVIQECNQQNEKDPELYKHFKIWLPDCIREAFKEYITKNYGYLLEPLEKMDSGVVLSEPTYLDDVEINCITFSGNDTALCEWYTLAHFISPRQLNLFVGELKDYVQYRQDIFRRSVCAGQFADEFTKKNACEEMKSKVKETLKIIEVLDFVRVVSGRVSNKLEDYYSDSKETKASEKYAKMIHEYIDFEIKDGKTYFESLKDFCCNTLKDGIIDIYADAENPKVLRNIELTRMYAGGDFILHGYNKISVDEVTQYYNNIQTVGDILAKGLCENDEDQNKVKTQQDLKRRITLNEVTDFYNLINDLLGNLISLSYLRERDYIYLLLGFYYMALRSECDWNGEIINSVNNGKLKVDGGFILYQALSIFDYGLKHWYVDGNGEWDKMGGSISGKITKFEEKHKESYNCAMRLFMDENRHEKQINTLRDYVDHSKYYKNYDKSLIELYNEFFSKFFGYSDRLKQSVLSNFKTILERYFIEYQVKFRENVGFCVDNNLSSKKFTYKLKEKKTVEIDARSMDYLEEVKQLLEYKKA